MGSEPTRWSLVSGAAQDKPGAREAFARRYEPVVRTYLGARWKGSPLRRELDDAAQEVFAVCFGDATPLAKADPERSFRVYLYGVVRNVARGFERNWSGRREHQPRSGFDAPANGESPSAVFDRAWASSLLREAADLQARRAVTAGARRRVELLRLRFEEDLPIREIAAVWEAPPERVHREYARARREFKRALHDLIRASEGGSDEQIEAEAARLLDLF